MSLTVAGAVDCAPNVGIHRFRIPVLWRTCVCGYVHFKNVVQTDDAVSMTVEWIERG